MRLHQITAQTKRRFVVTTDSRHTRPVAENRLDRQFATQQPNTCWAADFTYVWTQQGWLYLAVVLDLFSRRVVGWAMQTTMQRSLVVSARQNALAIRQPQGGLLGHSDRGSQYASAEYQDALRKAAATCSMSGKGDCWDNAPGESFFASLKRELVYRTTFATTEEARTALFDWIEVWYNRQRRHSALSYLSPEAFERQYKQQPQAQQPVAA